MSEELEALKEELKQAKLAYQMAAQMSQFKAGFLARTSHELRSPLNSLLGLHQLILSDLCESPEEEREFVAQAHQAALKLIKLLDDIIYVSKTEYGAHPLEILPFPLSEAFSELNRLIHLQAENRGYELEIAPVEPEIYVLADLKRLVQILASLVDTSIAYMKEGGIAIAARVSPQEDFAWVQIEVASSHEIWQEPLDLLQKRPLDVTLEGVQNMLRSPVPSPGMNLLLSYTLLETMGGSLEILQTPSDRSVREASSEENSPLTRIRCAIPLASEEMLEEELLLD